MPRRSRRRMGGLPTMPPRCKPAGTFDDEPGESAAAVWMRGGGLSADSSGNIYGATADGPFAAGTNFGQSVFKLSQSGNTLQLADWFTPSTNSIWTRTIST